MLKVYHDNKELNPSQIIFCDIGVPNNQGRFNLYADIKSKLVAGGLAEEQVIYARDYKKDAQKQALQDKMNAGGIVCIGTTKNMGVGKNVQERLPAIHDVSIPWTHRDMVQRGGRIDRFGNIFENIQRFQYVTKDSFDLFILQKLKQKAIIDKQTKLSPRDAAREIDEDVVPSYSQIMALSTGSPFIQEAIELEATVERLSMLSRSHLRAQSQREVEIKHLTSVIETWGNTLVSDGKERAMLGDKQITIQGKLLTGANKIENEKAFKAAAIKVNKIINLAKNAKSEARPFEVGDISGKTLFIDKDPIGGLRLFMDHEGERHYLAFKKKAGPLIKALIGLDDTLALNERRTINFIASKQQELDSMSQEEDSVFPHTEQLLTAKARLFEIESQMAEAGNDESESDQVEDPHEKWQQMLEELKPESVFDMDDEHEVEFN